MPAFAQQHRQHRVIIPRPDRVRALTGTSFAWLDTRLAREHWLAALSTQAIAVYAFLCLAANQQGISWYRRDKLRAALGLGEDELVKALSLLYRLDLVAYSPFHNNASEGFHQVLSLPLGGPPQLQHPPQLAALIAAIAK